MVLYETKGLRFVPQKWQGLINTLNIILFAWLVLCISIGIIDDWDFLFWFMLGYWVLFFAIRLYSVNSAVPIQLEMLEDSLRIICTRYFFVREIELMNDDVKIELYTSPHKGRMNTTIYYLYFYSRTDERIDIELKSDFHTLGKLLDQIYRAQKIHLHPRELDLVEKYREHTEWAKTTQGKIWRVLYPVLYLSVMALIVYMCSGK